jgi:hypothetical protein
VLGPLGFVHRAQAFFAAHGNHCLVSDNDACYRAHDFATVLRGARPQRITPYTPATTASRALQPDFGRRAPLRPRLDQRNAPHRSTGRPEHPLQLSPTPFCGCYVAYR